MYLVLTTFSSLYVKKYGEAVGISGLHYIALGLGFAFGAQAGARVLDLMYKKLKARNGGVGTPEMRYARLLVLTTLPYVFADEPPLPL